LETGKKRLTVAKTNAEKCKEYRARKLFKQTEQSNLAKIGVINDIINATSIDSNGD